jgi:hypothetical protein
MPDSIQFHIVYYKIIELKGQKAKYDQILKYLFFVYSETTCTKNVIIPSYFFT